MKTLETGISSPYVLSETKPYLKVWNLDKALLTAVTRTVAAEKNREENFAVRSRKNKGGVFTVSTSDY